MGPFWNAEQKMAIIYIIFLQNILDKYGKRL